MTMIPATPPRIEDRRFRTRSGDADWDFFPLGHCGRGYRVNEAQRARLLRIRDWTIIGGFLPPAVLFIVMDNANPWRMAPLVLAFLAYVVLIPTARWLYVRRRPPAERPLTRLDICGFLARTQSRSEVLRQLVLATLGAIACLVLFAVGVHMAKTIANAAYVWPAIGGAAYFTVNLAYKAWEAYSVRSLQEAIQAARIPING